MKKFLIVLLVLVFIAAIAFIAYEVLKPRNDDPNNDNPNGGAEQTFTVTFDTRGGSSISPVTVKKGDTLTLPESPTRLDYTFAGWFYDVDLTMPFKRSQPIESDIILYAGWTADNCNHNPVVDAAVQPTCTDTGLSEGSHCSVCNKTLIEQQIVPALGHDLTHHDGKAPTCTEAGWNEYDTCSRCEYTTYQELNALNHDLVHHEALAPTCTEIGWNEYDTCSRCEYTTYSEISINPDNHTFDDGVCTSCGYIENDSEGLEYALNDDGESYYVKGIGTFEGSNLKIPSVYNDKPVTMIGYEAFEDCTGLKRVVILDSVTSIADYAFYDCTGLTSVTIGSGVTSIGSCAFYGCTGLTSITIPDSVTSIDYCTFYGCTGLTSITIPNSVTSIAQHAFSGCTGLTSITIPDSVTSIDYCTFSGCTGLTSIAIPDSVTSIDSYAFYNTAWYNNQPDGLVYAGKVAYKYKGTMPDNTQLVLKEETKSITADAFYNCTSLTNITIPDSVTSIGYRAFSNCTGLTSVTIPDSVTTIGEKAFGNCTGLKNIIGSADMVSIVATQANPTSFSVNITSGDSIGKYAFYGCTGLKSITIPDSVTSIGKSAFYKCTSLTSVTIGKGVTSIKNDAFIDCSNLKNIYYTGDVASWCAISGLGELMSGLKTLYIGGNKVKDLVIPDGVTSIGSYAFSYCTGLTSITIPDSVKSIGDYAFRGYTGLTSIIVSEGNTVYHSKNNCLIETASKKLILGCKNSVIPNDGSVKSIGKHAFQNCTGLTSITIPGSVTSIGSFAFYNCTKLTSITIPDSVTTIGEDAFYNTAWYNNQSDGVVYAGKFAYDYKGTMSDNARIVLKEGTKGIAYYAFSDCTGLTSITIPNSVTRISGYAFYGCTGLTRIAYNGTVEQWNAIVKIICWNLNTGEYTIYCTDGNIAKDRTVTYV